MTTEDAPTEDAPTAVDAFLGALARATGPHAEWDGDRPISVTDVDRVDWCQVQHGMCSEEAFRAVVRLKDGRRVFVRGQCDTTGWSCVGNRWEVRDATATDEWRATAWPEDA